MARTSADRSIPPPLRALGGWPDADWFDASILSESEVVGINLPKLPGCRKQSFDLAERFVIEGKAGKGGRQRPAAPPAGIAAILDGVGTTREASFRRPSFFFEAAPVLHFAEIPAANLKVRAADALRRNLVVVAFRGCVLRQEARRVVAMFWPAAELEITAFIRAAAPPYAPHAQFDEAEAARRVAEPARRGFLGGRRAQQAERDPMLAELEALRARVAELQQSQSVVGAMQTLGLDDARLKSMLRLLHPDRHGNSEAANEATKWVNGLRELLK